MSVLPLALLTYFSLSFAGDAVSREVESRLRSTAAVSATIVDRELVSLKELVASYALRPSLVASLARDGSHRDGPVAVNFHLRQLRAARGGIAVAFVADPNGRLLDIVPATPSIVGDDFSFRDWYRGVVRTRRPYISTVYRTQATGAALVAAVASPVRSPSGRMVGILVAAYGLDHLQRLSDEIAATQDVRLRVTDQRGRLVATPGGVRDLVSRRGDPRVAAALRGRSGVTTLDTPDGRRLSAFAAAPESGWTVTASVPAGTAFAAIGRLRSTVFIIVALLGAGLLVGVLVLVRALAARKRAEEAARRQAAVNESVLEATRDAIGMIGADGTFAVANGAMERLVSEMVGEPADLVHRRRALTDVVAQIADLTTEPEAFRRTAAELAADPERIAVNEYELAEPHRVVESYAGPVRDAAGNVVGRVFVLRDVTAEREAERLRSEFTATVSHELRTPLASILGFSELLVHRELDRDVQRRYLGMIHGEAERLTALINDFLDLQRIEQGQLTLALESFDLRPLLREQGELFSAQSGVHDVAVEVAPEELTVLADRGRVTQVVGNLLSNAIKYSPDGGTVTLAAHAAGDAVRVSVTDSGLGIPVEQQGLIFEKFARVDSSDTRQIGGTGLGLALCREIVEAHGGRIGFESVEGAGSTFWFEVPSGRRRNGSGRGRVLVIEDDAAAAELLSAYLREEGFAAVVASSGEEGIALASREPPLLVCLDIRLAGDMDGWEVLTRLKEDRATADVPVVVCTARNGRDRAAALGATDFLTKPFSGAQLRDAVVAVVPRRAGSVLVVDDDPSMRRLVVETLSGEGLELREAADGVQALGAIADRRPDAVVLDLSLPGLDGFGVLEHLQADAETRVLPVLVLTARDLSREERARLQRQAVTLLEKSLYSPAELRRLIGVALGARAADARQAD